MLWHARALKTSNLQVFREMHLIYLRLRLGPLRSVGLAVIIVVVLVVVVIVVVISWRKLFSEHTRQLRHCTKLMHWFCCCSNIVLFNTAGRSLRRRGS